MLIRKSFRFEHAHVVRNCTTRRCAFSLHGHSYVVEILLTASALDRGGMVLDFGILKGVTLDSVIVHETATASAQCWRRDAYDPAMGGEIEPNRISFSEAIRVDRKVYANPA